MCAACQRNPVRVGEGRKALPSAESGARSRLLRSRIQQVVVYIKIP